MQFSTPDRGPPSEGSPQPRQRNQRPSRRQQLPPPHRRLRPRCPHPQRRPPRPQPLRLRRPRQRRCQPRPHHRARTGGDTPASRAGGAAATTADLRQRRQRGNQHRLGPARHLRRGRRDLSPASATAIKNTVQSAPSGGNTSFNVVGYAAGTPEDPSTARRLSLSRALAVRSALIADGVDSSRIYVRALGAAGGAEAPDRVDLAVMGGNAPAAETGAKSQPP